MRPSGRKEGRSGGGHRLAVASLPPEAAHHGPGQGVSVRRRRDSFLKVQGTGQRARLGWPLRPCVPLWGQRERTKRPSLGPSRHLVTPRVTGRSLSPPKEGKASDACVELPLIPRRALVHPLVARRVLAETFRWQRGAHSPRPLQGLTELGRRAPGGRCDHTDPVCGGPGGAHALGQGQTGAGGAFEIFLGKENAPQFDSLRFFPPSPLP